MATIVDKDVGGGNNDYADLGAAVTALNAVALTALDEIWRFNIYPYGGGSNGEIQLSSTLQLNGASDTTRYAWFRAAPGYGIADNANKLTDALRYDTSNGVAINCAANGVSIFTHNNGYVRISDLQLKSSAATSAAVFNSLLGNPGIFENLLVENNAATAAFVYFGGSVTNCLVYNTNASADSVLSYYAGTGSARNCTLIGSGSTTQAIKSASGNTNIVNTAVFGCAAFSDGNNGTCSNNASNLSSVPGSSAQASLTYASQFESVTGGSEDWRVKAGSALIGAGVRDQTYTGDLDIIGQSRSTSAPAIGAWEVVETGGGSGKLLKALLLQA